MKNFIYIFVWLFIVATSFSQSIRGTNKVGWIKADGIVFSGDDTQLTTTDGIGGGDVIHSWSAVDANLAVSSPPALEFSTNATGQIVWQLAHVNSSDELSRFSFTKTAGLSTNMNVKVRLFGVTDASEEFTILVQEVGQARNESSQFISTGQDIDNLVTFVFTNGLQTVKGDDETIYVDIGIGASARGGNIDVERVIVVEKPEE